MLESLYDDVLASDIRVYDFHISETKKAACFHSGDHKAILLDRPVIRTEGEECVILAEELGHYETGGLYLLEATINMPVYRNNILKCEGRAKRWKIKRLLPFDELKEAVQDGYIEYYELSEHFNLPVHFIKEAVELYTETLGLSFAVDGFSSYSNEDCL